MRAIGLGLLLAIVASECFAAPMIANVQIFNGAPGVAVPSNPVPGSPSIVSNPTSATVSFGYPASQPVGLGVGSISDQGSVNLYNRSQITSTQFQTGGIGALDPGSLRVITTTEGIFTRAALSGNNDLTLNILNLLLEVLDPSVNAKASIQATIDVTFNNNSFQSFGFEATLTRQTGGVMDFEDDAPFFVGNVTSSGPAWSTLNGGQTYTSPAFAVIFHLGDLVAGSTITIDYRAITTAISPNAPNFQAFQSVRAQFGDPDNSNSSSNNANLRLTAPGVVEEVPEPSALILCGLCAIVGIAGRRFAV
jgi:hypothetical protein